MTRVRYTMSARPQGKLYMQRQQAHFFGKGVHRWVFANNIAPDVETLVRKWLTTRLDAHRVEQHPSATPTSRPPHDRTRRTYKVNGRSDR